MKIFRTPRRLGALVVSGAIVLLSNGALAKEVLLDAAPMHDKKLRLDGMLREWPALVPLSEELSGRAKASGVSAEGVVGYDADNLYVAMHFKDAHQKRSAAFSENEDHATLALSFPGPGASTKSYRVLLFPGVPGKSDGAVEIAGKGKVSGARIIEAPEDGGMAFEATIPWAAFPEAKRVRSGLRGALVYKDADSGVVLATSKKQGAALPPLTIEAEYALNQSLVLDKGINPRPSREAVGNVVGDAMYERVALFDRYLTVTGWNYRKGTEFYFQDLQVAKAGDVERLSLVDMTGDGHDDIVLERRVGAESEATQYLEIWHFRASDDGPQLIFQHLVQATKGDDHITNRVAIEQVRGKYQVVVSQGDPKDTKVDPNTWDVPPAGGITQPMLLPWQSIQSRSFGWKGDKFELLEEKTGKPRLKGPPGRGTRLWSGSAPPSSRSRATEGDPMPTERSKPAPPVAAPRKPTADELSDGVYQLYRTERSATRSKPSFDFVTNVAGDETAERVLVHAKDLVVFGKRFKQGTSYEYMTLGFEDPKDVLQVETRDLTGDGRAELIVHGVLRAKASKRLGGDVVTRHALYIYSVKESGIVRIFAAETGRSLGDNRILGGVRFVPAGGSVRIELHPGRAVGWSQATYPFPEDRTPYGGLEPLLLPWTEQPVRSYQVADGKFQAVP